MILLQSKFRLWNRDKIIRYHPLPLSFLTDKVIAKFSTCHNTSSNKSKIPISPSDIAKISICHPSNSSDIAKISTSPSSDIAKISISPSSDIAKILTSPSSDIAKFSTSTKILLDRLRQGNRRSLAKLITLVESSLPSHMEEASKLMEAILRDRDFTLRKSFRIGLSGAPGVGKSTFIETFGQFLIKKGHKVAVLAVDPTSTRTGGSILGDKTRMVHLACHPLAYVRPSPSKGTLGGVGKNTTEAIFLCEEAGYDIIIVETVGVGQSETAVECMVDMFVLLVPPAGGDELQGLKKGIVELADLIVVNKADGDLQRAAKGAQYEYMNALKFLSPKSPHWKPKVLTCSSVTMEGIDQVWVHVSHFFHFMKEKGELGGKRSHQSMMWMWRIINESFVIRLSTDPKVATILQKTEGEVKELKITPFQGANKILDTFFKNQREDIK